MKSNTHLSTAKGFVQLTFFLLFFTHVTFGFDNKLKGFILSIGGGFGKDIIVPYVKIDTSKGFGNTRYNTALCLDLKLGYNYGNRFELAYMNKSDIMYPYTTMIINNYNEIELSYYLRESFPTIFIPVSAGGALWLYPFNDAMNSRFFGYGFSLSLGTGVEFIKHVAVVLEYQFSQPGHYDRPSITVNDTLTGQITSRQIDFAQIYYTNAIRLAIRYSFY